MMHHDGRGPIMHHHHDHAACMLAA
jgi:hypothetical protein